MTALQSLPRLVVFLLVLVAASAAAAGGRPSVRPPSHAPARPSASQSQSAHADQAASQAEKALAAQCEAQFHAGHAALERYRLTWKQLDAEQKALAGRYRLIWSTLDEAAKRSVVSRWESLAQEKRSIDAQIEHELLAMKQSQASCARSLRDLQ